MERGSRVRALLAGFALLAAAGCGETDDIEQVQSAISGGWVALPLGQGWSNYNTANPPAIGRVNGILTLRGAVKGDGTATTHVFTLPPGYRPMYGERLELRTVTAFNTGGTVYVEIDHTARIYEDGVSTSSLGPNAKFFTSLDGISFDTTAEDATHLIDDVSADGNWAGLYGHRLQGMETSANVKNVGGFVRFQGWLTKNPGGDPNSMFLFQLPSQFRPGQSVWVPTTLCGGGGTQQTYGRLNIVANTGNVYVQPANGNYAAANCSVSLENISFALSQTTQTLNFQFGWNPYNQRPVRVRLSGGVVRFQGSIDDGTATVFANMLPTNMRPPVNVYLQADSWNAAHARIVVTPDGTMFFDTPSLSVASGFLSLDGVSFGL